MTWQHDPHKREPKLLVAARFVLLGVALALLAMAADNCARAAVFHLLGSGE